MRQARGFTLVELVVAIALIGILAAVASLYIAPALNAYFASGRRAELADLVDTATRRMLRDVRLALPNSARTASAGADRFLEILLTRTGGRYRAVNDDDNPAATAEIPLVFHQAAASFDAYETAVNLADIPADQRIQANDYVVIHNLGIAGADAYEASAPNIAQVSAFTFHGGALPDENRIALNPAKQFPLESPGQRFFVVSGPVSYACTGMGVDAAGDGTGSLRRWSGYAVQSAQPTAAPVGATNAVLAAHVSACEFTYIPLPLASRGLVSVRLAITRSGETVTLYYEAHVNNVP
jgi:MSHA biogenesis protein MshO